MPLKRQHARNSLKQTRRSTNSVNGTSESSRNPERRVGTSILSLCETLGMAWLDELGDDFGAWGRDDHALDKQPFFRDAF